MSGEIMVSRDDAKLIIRTIKYRLGTIDGFLSFRDEADSLRKLRSRLRILSEEDDE